MELFLIALVVLLVFGNAFAFFLWMRDRAPRGQAEKESQGMMMLQQQLQELTRTMNERMGESTRTMHDSVKMQFNQSQDLIRDINRDVNEKLLHVVRGVTEVSESSKQVFSLAEQLQNLEKVLKHQKQRGNLGEASLQLALENMLPATAFKMQYEFPGGETVDSVIMTKDGMIPVDAKFSLDNYRRLVDETDENRKAELENEFKNDLKKRIDETAKYIRTKDGTLPFAFMYIPAEAIYYDLLVNEVGSVKVNTRSLIDYAYKDKHVIIVSPTTFAAYLQSVLYGFRAFKIEETAKDIAKNVESLSRHIKAYEDYYKKLGNSLSTTVNHFNAGSKELGKIDKDVTRITGASMGIEAIAIERPQSADPD
jgi:DNA recombination protein RmuC